MSYEPCNLVPSAVAGSFPKPVRAVGRAVAALRAVENRAVDVDRPLRIAQVAPIFERVPPELYGGTERVVSALTEELVRRGHEVALFASGDSLTAAHLVAACPRATRLDPALVDRDAFRTLQLGQVFQQAAEFDVIHSHIDHFGFPLAWANLAPVVTTMHGRLDIPELRPLLAAFPALQLVSISQSQRAPVQDLDLNWLSTVYNGICMEHFDFVEAPGEYLVFLGRMSPEKRPDRAIEIARALEMPLKMAAKVDPVDGDYFAAHVKPLLDTSLVEFLGEVDEQGKNALLGGAAALLFPIDWPEPFGLTMTEAMACGTPVVAMRHGSVPEIIHHGVTGYTCDSVAEMIAACRQLDRLDRWACRDLVASRFSAERMVDGYEAIYRRVVAERPDQVLTVTPAALPVPRAARPRPPAADHLVLH